MRHLRPMGKKHWISVGAAAMTLMGTFLVGPNPAAACGGCFVPPAEDSQVTGHRMILSVSPTQTTLYDQFEYSGNPEDFAWVLPIRGRVEVGISSDVLFNQLGQGTQVQVVPPPLDCPVYEPCEGDRALGASGGAAPNAAETDGAGVEVLVEEVVGPYETVQLRASESEALSTWLVENGYNLPPEIEPIIAAYQEEEFDFLALKLAPDEGVERMAPVRVTTPGAGVSLPLRMVAAGTGARTTMTLFVVAEGRYEPSNFPIFRMTGEAVTWNWGTNSSDYAELRQAQIDDSQGRAWQVEASLPQSPDFVRPNRADREYLWAGGTRLLPRR
ncbi:MAG: DUF2330 domain-containing protein [Myxococcota bacterium]